MDCAVKAQRCVDVVIPVFNGRETINAALTSVVRQQGDWVHRIIVVDDGSNDGTAQVVHNLSSPLIELVQTQNQGVSMARNLGIEKSTAEWVAFLDADDTWIPSKLKAQLSVAQEHDASFVCGAVSSESVMPSGVISAEQLARGNFVATSSVLVKRSVLQQVNPVFTPGMSFAEDYLVWLKCVTLSPGYYLSEKLVDYTLSEHPRYRWGQILRNLIGLNFRYAVFLQQIGTEPLQRMRLGLVVLFGSLLSVLSILKRFIRSYLKVFANK